MDPAPAANIAQVRAQRFGWPPAKLVNLPRRERAYELAPINVRCEAERKKEAELKSKMKRGKRR